MTGQEQTHKSTRSARRPRGMEGVMVLLGHGVATLVVALLGLMAVLGPGHLRALLELESATATPWLGHVAGHLALSALCWALIYLAGRALLKAARPERSPRLVRAQGAVATETLIVMPVLLLLVFGLAQLAVVNIAGMLANYAAVQAGRAVWVWHPETQPLNDQGARRGVTEAMVIDHARVQAAAALAPVAPGDHQISGDLGSPAFTRMCGMMMTSQVENPPNDSGRVAQNIGFDSAGNEDATF